MADPRLNVPNVVSGVRVLLVPILLWCALHQLSELFLYLLALSLFTDCVDGYLARRLNQCTNLGAKLDSWGDMLTYGSMVLGLLWLWPHIFNRESWFLYLAIASYLVPLLTSLLKFQELPSYHTWAAKIAAVLMAPAYFLLVLFDLSALFRMVVIFHIWVAIEEVIITFMLNRGRSNIPTLFHALEIMRRQRAVLRARNQQRRERRAQRRSGDKPPTI